MTPDLAWRVETLRKQIDPTRVVRPEDTVVAPDRVALAVQAGSPGDHCISCGEQSRGRIRCALCTEAIRQVYQEHDQEQRAAQEATRLANQPTPDPQSKRGPRHYELTIPDFVWE